MQCYYTPAAAFHPGARCFISRCITGCVFNELSWQRRSKLLLSVRECVSGGNQWKPPRETDAK
jgi:hypothetical protein